MQKSIALHPGIRFLLRCLLSWFSFAYLSDSFDEVLRRKLYLISISSFMSISSPLLS